MGEEKEKGEERKERESRGEAGGGLWPRHRDARRAPCPRAGLGCPYCTYRAGAQRSPLRLEVPTAGTAGQEDWAKHLKAVCSLDDSSEVGFSFFCLSSYTRMDCRVSCFLPGTRSCWESGTLPPTPGPQHPIGMSSKGIPRPLETPWVGCAGGQGPGGSGERAARRQSQELGC